MNLFIFLLFALCAMGVLAICSIEPARRTFLEGMAITVLFGFSFIIAVVIYMGLQAL
ncbi:hypothetical protein [Roseovarius aestuarii]|uniref:Uncharacterized protein n=1 Tax=Roseovarius aestuarii TaxID=475083 RepID=A0A1X7BSI2_9RHOB|nr:hypothetical protein [Roseovarius aestuarii]SMC12169.1 hypothetical protein ROA7745_01992 [Roseovarius aestuarii]